MANKNEAKIKFTAETGEFNDTIKKSNEEMSKLRAEMKLNETQMKATGASVEALENKHKILSNQLSASESKTEALTQKVNKAVEIFGENSTEVTKLRTQLINAQAAEEKVKQAIAACNEELEVQKSAANQTETATEKLTNTIEEQKSALNKLKGDYVEAVLQYGETSDEAKALERAIRDLSNELKQNKTAFSDASDKADKLEQSLDKVEESTEKAGDGFTVMKGVIAGLVTNAIQGAVSALGDLVSYFAELPAETMELRQDFATLTTSFDEMGFSAETATSTWKDLYAVFGEDDRAVETANNISKMAQSQEDLSNWVTITTGVWGTYQDSLPVEGLAEASNETAKTGQVTGVLADALNWSSEAAVMFADYMGGDVVTAEDAFNVALSECSNEQERQQLITETLTKLYGSAADTYRDAAGAQMDAKDATAEQILAENNLAAAIEPVTTAFAGLKTSLLTGMLPAIESLCGWLTDTFKWMQENQGAVIAITSVIGVLTVAIGTFSAAMAVKNAMDAANVTTVWALVAAHWAQATAGMAALAPYILAVAAIAAVIAIIVVCIKYWDEIVAAVKKCWDQVCATLAVWGAWINTNVVQPIKEFFSGLWDDITSACFAAWSLIKSKISTAVSAIKAVITAVFDAVKAYITTVIDAWKNIITTAWDAIKNVVSTAVDSVRNTISTVFEAMKTIISSVMSLIKSVVTGDWEGVKASVSNIVNAIKDVIGSVWNGIKSTVSSAVNGVKSTVFSVFNGIKSTATSVWNGIKNAILTPIEAAKNKIKSIIDTIKGLFSGMKISWPSIKMPHFAIKPAGWKIGDLLKGSIPKLSISWYKEGAIFTKPTIFGTPFGFKGVGEAGAEAVLPIDKLEGYISSAIEKAQNVVNLQSLAGAIEDLANRPIQMNINGRQVAVATASDGDSVNGLRSSLKGRGLAIE